MGNACPGREVRKALNNYTKKNSWCRWVRTATILFLALGALPVSAKPPVVMLSIDGLRPDYVLQADLHGLRIPNLRRLLQQGAHSRGVHIFLPTVTYPGHTTLVTGVTPARHGILNNQPFDPYARNEHGWKWYAEDIKVPTLWDVATQAGLKVGSIDWPVTVGAGMAYLIPQFWRASTVEDGKLLRALATPGLLAEAEKTLGPYPVNADYTVAEDKRRAAFAVHMLQTQKPDLLLSYFGGLDEVQHQHGPFSPQAIRALEDLDVLVGQLWEADRDGIFVVVSDHGFAPMNKAVYLNAVLRKEGLITLDGEGQVLSWKASIWNGIGCGAVMLAPGSGPEVVERVTDLLRNVAQDPQSGIDHLEMGSGLPRGGFPDAALVIYMKPGYALYNDLGPGELVRDADDGGTHGYSPQLPEMNASFFAAGPGIPAGLDLGYLDARSVAPTIAAFLGLKMPSADLPPLAKLVPKN